MTRAVASAAQVVAPVSQLNVIFGQPECEAPSRRRLQARRRRAP
jgi:hypothetical protein